MMIVRQTWHRQMLIWLGAMLFSLTAFAHKPSDSYLNISAEGEQLSAQWDIALKDLEFLIGLDNNQNGEITWGELKAQRQAIAAHALSRLSIVADGQDCAPQLDELLVNQHSDGGYAVLALSMDCPANAQVLDIRYNLLFDADPTHRGLVLFSNGDITSTYVLSPNEPMLELQTGESSLWQSFKDYILVGMWHIWVGFDHILFLLSLLIPAVLVWRKRQWHSVDTFKPAVMMVLKIVTAFTVAHSITLWLAVMEYVTLPGQLVEVTIAFSIIVTALNNLYPILPLSRWVIAFVFGLVHGFGFANVLLDLGLSSTTLAVSLVGFNVGVELGQIVIVLVFLPIAFMMRGTLLYRWLVLRLGSVLVVIIAALWMYERLFNAEIIGF